MTSRLVGPTRLCDAARRRTGARGRPRDHGRGGRRPPGSADRGRWKHRGRARTGQDDEPQRGPGPAALAAILAAAPDDAPRSSGPAGPPVVDTRQATILVPRTLVNRLIVDLDAPITRLADSWLAIRAQRRRARRLAGPGDLPRPGGRSSAGVVRVLRDRTRQPYGRVPVDAVVHRPGRRDLDPRAVSLLTRLGAARWAAIRRWIAG